MKNKHAYLLPLPLKLGYTGFMAVMVPVYYVNYGPTNFLYFCDVALFLCLGSVWTEHPLPASMASVGILLPQLLWCVDFAGELLGVRVLGMTAYMFNPRHSRFLRGLSLFHGWLPFLLLYVVRRLGYDRRALGAWTALAWGLCLFSYLRLPPAGTVLADPRTPVNVNYVYGFDDTAPQTHLPPPLYLAGYMVALVAVAFVPTHWALKKWLGRRKVAAGAAVSVSALR